MDQAEGPGRSEPELSAASIDRASAVELLFSAGRWPFAEAHRGEVEAHWRGVLAARPGSYNGKVLKVHQARLDDGIFRGEAFETDFASFLFWRDSGFPETGVRNVFGSAVIRSSEDAIVLGRMADWTANAGLVYPFGGSLDCGDVVGGRVDVERSIARELLEETGLAAAEALAAPDWLVVWDGPRVSLAKVLDFPMPTASVVDRILLFVARQSRPELQGVHVVRSTSDLLPERMPSYAQALVRHLLAVRRS